MTTPRLVLLERVLRGAADVAEAVGPQDLGRPTPCPDYDVRALLEHLIGWQLVFAACTRDADPPIRDGSPTYTASTNPAQDLVRASAALVDGLRQRGDRTLTLPYRGPTQVPRLADELVAETVLHTWDLATATGRHLDVDDDTLAVAHTGLTLLLGESFAAVGFRRPPPDPRPRTELERLVLRSGRPLPLGDG